MRKMVNGEIVDIENIGLFELAADGQIMRSKLCCKVDQDISCDIDKYLKCYDAFYKTLPFPLSGLEDNIKYAVLGILIEHGIGSDEHIWVNDGLCIEIREGKKVRFIGNTWCIEDIDSKDEDTKSIDIEVYEECTGYEEYKWILDRVLNKEDTSDFYSVFMPEFACACDNDPEIIKNEISKILRFSGFKNNLDLPFNKIINLDTEYEYIIDIFYTGIKKLNKKGYKVSLIGDKYSFEEKDKYIDKYDFRAYEKEYSYDEHKGRIGAIRETKVNGFYNLFRTLMAIKIANNSERFSDFQGFIASTSLIYVVGSTIYECKAYGLSDIREVARDAKLCGFDCGILYYSNRINVGNGIVKEFLYAYYIADGSTRLCEIKFKGGVIQGD